MTAVDTNVIIALWDRDPGISSSAQKALDTALALGSLVISAPVFAELMAAPGRTEAFLDKFCDHTGIEIDFILMRKFGGLLAGHSKLTRAAAGSSMNRDRDASWLIL